jgi:hypothetical protein
MAMPDAAGAIAACQSRGTNPERHFPDPLPAVARGVADLVYGMQRLFPGLTKRK